MASIFFKTIKGISYTFEQMSYENIKTSYRVSYEEANGKPINFRLTKDKDEYWRVTVTDEVPEHLYSLEPEFNKAIREQ